MESINDLAALICRDEDAVRRAGMRWACALHASGSRCGSEEATGLADAALRALVMDGAEGLLELAEAGPALGGLRSTDVAAIVLEVHRMEAAQALQAA